MPLTRRTLAWIAIAAASSLVVVLATLLVPALETMLVPHYGSMFGIAEGEASKIAVVAAHMMAR